MTPLSRYRTEVEGISGLAPALPVSASQRCELWFSTAPGTTNKHFVTSPSFPLSSACLRHKHINPHCLLFQDALSKLSMLQTRQTWRCVSSSLLPPFKPSRLHANLTSLSKITIYTLSREGRSVINWSQVLHGSQTRVTPACCSKLPLYRRCVNTSPVPASATPQEFYCTGSRHTSFPQLPAELQEQGDGPQPPLYMPEPLPSS